jgi:Fe-S cluster assembly protein SufD
MKPPTGATEPSAPTSRAVMDTGTDAILTAYAELFAQTERDTDPSWLATLRRDAMDRLTETGFPTTKDEDWHFTNPGDITSRTFVPARSAGTVTAEHIAPYLFDGEWDTLVFVNGIFSPSLSRAERGRERYVVTNLAQTLAKGPQVVAQKLGGIAPKTAFTSLNTAFLQDGLFLLLGPDVVVERPIHVIHVADATADGQMISPRTLIFADHHAEATVVESYVSLGDTAHFTNAISEVYLSAGARIKHYKIQREGVRAFHVGSVYAHQEQDSDIESFSFAVGASLSRTNIETILDGTGSHATVNGLYMVTGTQTVDHQTRIEHAKENCTSHEVYRGVLDGESHAVFNGKVYVHPEAQKTDGKQSNNNLLLSDRARVDTKPQLEIFADDVKCTHGATIGRLDQTALFYLKSRGVGKETAQRLLTYAFAADVLEQLTIESVKVKLEELTFERFAIEG